MFNAMVVATALQAGAATLATAAVVQQPVTENARAILQLVSALASEMNY